MKHVYIVLAMTLFVSACSSTPSENAIQTAIAKTQAAQPPTIQPTATLISLKNLDLEKLVYVQGDLPGGLRPGQYLTTAPDFIGNKTLAVNAYGMSFEGSVSEKGIVFIWLYESSDDINSAVASITNSLKAYEAGSVFAANVQPVGDKTYVDNNNDHYYARAVFVRCKAVIYVGVQRDYKEVANYARRIIKRLEPFVCQ